MRVAASAGSPASCRERRLQLAQHHDQACLLKLGRVVVAIARPLVDARRHQHPAFVAEAECLSERRDRRANSPMLISFTLTPSSPGRFDPAK
jgi:hypothetical protein